MTEISDERLRSLELIDFSSMPNLKINIIGMGAVGSRVFEQLVCLGCRNINCYDFDEVEAHNLHNQLWIRADVGKKKVDAAKAWFMDKYAEDPSDYDMHFIDERVTEEAVRDQMTGIVMLCVDTFEGRRQIAQGAADSGGEISLVIEGRCAPKFNNVRCVDPSDERQVKTFMESLGSDDDPEVYVSICGLPISFAPVMIACGTMMVMHCVNFLKEGQIIEMNQMTNFISSPMLVLGARSMTGE